MKKLWALCLCAVMLCALVPSGMAEVRLSPQHPEVLTLWHYYNGLQQREFNTLVLQFNETVGKEMGIIIEPVSQGGISSLYEHLMAAVRGDIGAAQMPDICAAYADTVYEVSRLDLVADLSAYMTADEMSEYVDAYMQEGAMNEAGKLKLFPTAKSTEMMLVNKTEWDAFAAETGATVEQLATWEGVVDVSRLYWQWSDAKTDTPNDGKAFFGRDSFANYIIIGAYQLGAEICRVENGEVVLTVDHDVMRRLWDNYTVPYVNGWFGAYGRFRSDDVKTGLLTALVGSTSGALYFPDSVTMDDGTSYPIECMPLPLPGFEGTEPCAVQQGAGLFVKSSTPEREYAAMVFLRWFTQTENNIDFCIGSGYLPVLKEANRIEVMEEMMDRRQVSGLLRNIIEVGVQITGNYDLYTNTAFENGNEVRSVIDRSMSSWAQNALAERDALVAGGVAWDDAVAMLTGDDAFEAWYAQFSLDLARAVGR